MPPTHDATSTYGPLEYSVKVRNVLYSLFVRQWQRNFRSWLFFAVYNYGILRESSSEY